MPPVQQWLRLLSSSNPAHRKRAVDGLLPHLEQVPLTVLLELLDHPTSPEVRSAVASALQQQQDESLAAEMLHRLEAEQPEVRSIACSILGEVGGAAAFTALLPLLSDADSAVRQAAASGVARAANADAIHELATRAVTALLPLFSDADSSVRETVARSVAKLADADTFHELTTRLPEEIGELLCWARRAQEPPLREGDPEDDALIEATFQRLADKATREGIEALSPMEQAVFLPHWAVGLIGNGGFRYFFEGATEIRELAAACEALGLPDAAKACRLAGEQVLPEVLEGGYERCSQWMDTLTEGQLEAMFERSDRLFPGSAGEIRAPLAAYIREHQLALP